MGFLQKEKVNLMLLKTLTILFVTFLSALSAEENFNRSIHSARLSFLKSKGFEPKVIYDIGAYDGSWTREIKGVFPRAQFFLFEANEKHRSSLEGTFCPFFLVLLGDQDKTVTFYSNGSTGDSVFIEQTKFYQGNHYQKKTMPMTTLAKVVEQNHLPLPDFIKIDVQGAEQLILRGSSEVIKNAEAIVMETKVLEYNKGAPFAHETISLMNELGYSFQDVFECHYLPTGELSEIDLLFLKKDSTLIRRGLLSELSE